MYKKGDIVEIKNEDKYNLWKGEKNSTWIVEHVMDVCCSVKHIGDISSYGGININIEKCDLRYLGNIKEIANRY